MNLKALQQITYGVYVIGSRKDDRLDAQIANTLVQICSEPPAVSVCINKQSLTHEFIQSSKVFTASILSRETPLSFIGRFGFKSGRETNKLEGVNYKLGETGAPIVLENALAYLEARIINEADAMTHTIFLGQIVAGEVIREGEPMTYAYYHEVKRGTIPKSAPHYVAEEGARTKEMKYRCTVCGYIYDPEKGDPDGGISPGMPFEKLPDSWVCPVCGAAKADFEKLED